MNGARRDVRTLFDLYNVHIRKDALDYLTEITKEKETDERKKYISNIITKLRSELLTIQSLDLETLKKLLVATRKDANNFLDEFQIVNMPTELCHLFNPKTYMLDSKLRSSTIQEEFKQTNFFQRRMLHILNTLDRSLEKQKNIKPIEQLFSENAGKSTILATALRIGGEEILAEDLTGSIPIEFARTKMNGWLPFEGGCFLFDGQQMDGIFTVDDVYLPISKMPNQLPHMSTDDVFNRQKFPVCSEDDRIVILSDIWLDHDRILKSLNHLFMQFVEKPPSMMIFCGSFHSSQVGINYLQTEIENFKKLARLISDFTATFPDTKFVFVPSNEDLPVTPVMPRYAFLPSIQKTFAGQKNVHFATNPCKILFKNRVISIIRDNTVEKVARSSLCAHRSGIDVIQSFVDTIWSQRHLSPVLSSISPIVPNYDDSLLIQFNPDLLIVADKFTPFVWSPSGTPGALTCNPGSFGVNFKSFMMFWPLFMKVEIVPIVESVES